MKTKFLHKMADIVLICFFAVSLLLSNGCAEVQPSEQPSPTNTKESAQISQAPSLEPSIEPSESPSIEPSVEPSIEPEEQPTPLVVSDRVDLEQLACRDDLIIESETLESVSIEWLGGADGTIDLSGCTALKTIAISGGELPATLNLGETVEELSFHWSEGEFDEDYVLSLPNLKHLKPNKAFDLSKIEKLERLSLFIGDCDLSPLESAEIEVLALGGAGTHGIHAETLATFRGAKSLRAMQISDEYIADVSPILDYAPELKLLILGVDPYQNGPELSWAKVSAENAELLDKLVTNIPVEQLEELLARGCEIQLMPDYSVREPIA